MMPWWAMAVFVFGTNFTLWGSVGLMRLLDERTGRLRPHRENAGADLPARPATPTVDQVAVLMAAHNEELVIEDSLNAIVQLLPLENVHVVSDGSSDRTVELAEAMGVNVISTRSNIGKAGALQEGIERFGIVERFEVLMLLDADTRVDPGYFHAALPAFDDPTVVAVAGAVRTSGRERVMSPIGQLLVSHRQRIYAITQRMLKFGQTWSRLNATHIVPGFASMYRTEVLPAIDMNPPGLLIEDFNMTFEVYQKSLGKVGFTMAAVAVTQDPDNFRDYIRQTRRWSLGLWQTVRRHPPRLNLFTGMLTLLLLELLTSSMIFLLLPIVLLLLAVPHVPGWPELAALQNTVAAHVSLDALLYGVVGPDIALTIVASVLERQPRLLLFGCFFLLLRVVDAAVSIYTVPAAWLTRSTGRWQSPTRRETSAA